MDSMGKIVDDLNDTARSLGIRAPAEPETESPYKRFYEAVMECAGDTWQCERCGNAEPWWTETNADYATREIRAEIAKLEGNAKATPAVSDGLACPFCGDTDFDSIGLKIHLANWCDKYRSIAAAPEPKEGT